MRWSLVIATLGLVAPAAAQQYEVTLPEAVRRALTVQPVMVQARGDAAKADSRRRSAYGAFLPSVSAGASGSRSNKERIDPNDRTKTLPPIYTYSGSLSARLDLFTGFRRFAELRAASADQDAAGAGVIDQRFQVTLNTKRLFYDALANEELLRVAEAQVRRARQQLQISIEKLRAGSATRSDSLRSTVEYGNARIALLQAQADLATAQANLGRQIGLDAAVRAAGDTTLPPLPDTTMLRGTALRDAPQVEQAEAQASAARAGVWAARAQYLPTFFVTYGATRSDTLFPQLPLFRNLAGDSFEWRFGVSWTLFNGFAREREQVTASVARDFAEAQAADKRREVSAELTKQLATLATSYEQITIARANVAAATEDLRVQSERYRVGAATILDLLTSQTALTQAEVNLVQTRFNYLIALAQVEALVGREL